MENLYSANELITKFNISKETFYKVKKKNQPFFEENSVKVRDEEKRSKPLIKYNQAVYDFFASQYGIEEAVSSVPDAVLEAEPREGDRERERDTVEAPETPLQSFFSPADDVKPTQEDKNALQAKIEALEAKLAEAEAERKELISQNSHLLLLLSQEKQEKQLLLPAPKKSIRERIKGLFHKQDK